MKRRTKSHADNPQRLKQLLAVLVARAGGLVEVSADEVDALSGSSFEIWLNPEGARLKLTPNTPGIIMPHNERPN